VLVRDGKLKLQEISDVLFKLQSLQTNRDLSKPFPMTSKSENDQQNKDKIAIEITSRDFINALRDSRSKLGEQILLKYTL
jgi:hypothetical protein